LLHQHSLVAKLSKCSFGQKQIEYLGHVVTEEGVQVDESKITVVNQWPIPTTVKQLLAFLGLTSYYRRFIKNFAIIDEPLTNLLKKEAFRWSTHTEITFTTLKTTLTHAPVLVLPNFNQPFVLETDASSLGIGAVLTQNNHPIAFFSQTLTSRMQQKSAYSREMHANTDAVANFRHYLLGHKFVIKTDHQTLKEMQTQVI